MLKAALRFFAALLIVVPAVWFVLVALSPSYNSCIQNNGQHPTEHYTADGQQIVEGPIDNPTAFHLALVCGSNFANRNGEAFTGLFTIALTAATFLLGLLAWDQGRVTRAQLRPYVFVDGVKFERLEGGELKIRMRLKNHSSATPAFETQLRARADFAPDETLDYYGDPKEAFSKTTIGPGAVASMSAKFNPLEDGVWDNLMAGKTKLHLWGDITYRDVFGGRHYTTNFRLVNNGGPNYKEGFHQAEGDNEAT